MTTPRATPEPTVPETTIPEPTTPNTTPCDLADPGGPNYYPGCEIIGPAEPGPPAERGNEQIDLSEHVTAEYLDCDPVTGQSNQFPGIDCAAILSPGATTTIVATAQPPVPASALATELPETGAALIGAELAIGAALVVLGVQVRRWVGASAGD